MRDDDFRADRLKCIACRLLNGLPFLVPKNAKPIPKGSSVTSAELDKVVSAAAAALLAGSPIGGSDGESTNLLETMRAHLKGVDWDGFGVTDEATPQPQTSISSAALVRQIRTLGSSARAGDRTAMLNLFAVTSSAYTEMDSVPRAQPELFRSAFQKSIFWPTATSAVPCIAFLLEADAKARGAGQAVKESVRSKVNLRNPVTTCAFHLLSFMALARLGLVLDARFIHWTIACGQLPPLSDEAFSQWWKVASVAIIPEMFPKLRQMVFGKNSTAEKQSQGDAVAAVRRAAISLIPVFAVATPPPSKAKRQARAVKSRAAAKAGAK